MVGFNITKKDWIPGVIWLFFGGIITFQSYRIGIGTIHNLGPGMLPFLLGIILMLLSVSLLFHAYRDWRKRETQKETIWIGLNFRKMATVIVALILNGFLLDKIGFTLSVFVTMFILFRTVGSMKLFKVLVLSCLTVGLSYLVFVVILDVVFPSFPIGSF